MQLSHFLILTGAVLASAHPSAHAHLHRHHHEQRDVSKPSFYKNVHNKPKIPKPSPTAQPKPEALSAQSAEESAAPKPSAEAQYIPFCSEGKGYNKGGVASKAKRQELEKRVTEAQVKYTGNLGMDGGCPWNSNIMAVDPSIAHLYTYVQMYENVADTSYEVLCGNKMGAEPGQLTGMFDVPGQNLVRFNLAPGEKKAVVAQSNTQMVCAFAPGSVPKTPFGQYAGDWAETDFDNTSNGGWSGGDCSSLVAQHYDMDVPGCHMCDTITCSTIHPGGIGKNAYTKGMEKLDGIGLNCVPGPLTITIQIGIN